MFRPRHVAPALKDRVLAVAVAVALHAAVLTFAAATLEGGSAPLAPVASADSPLFRIKFLVLPGKPPASATDDGRGVALGRPQAPARHARPAPAQPEATYIPGAEKVLVDEGPGAETIHPDLPAVIIDEGPRTRSPRAGFAGATEAAGKPDVEPVGTGDSARRGPPVVRGAWMLMGVSWSTVSGPRPSRYCVPRAPSMPEGARLAGITGTVDALYEVGDDGVVRSEVLDGQPLLAGAVRAWLRGCLFEPSVQNGRRAPARVHQTFDFVLR